MASQLNYSHVKKTCLIFILLLSFSFCFSQNSARVSVVRGARLIFNFESMDNIQNGRTLGSAPTGFTELELYYKHATINGWNLYVEATTANLEGDYNAVNINLSAINLHVYIDGVFSTTVSLGDVSPILIGQRNGDYTAGGTHTVTISYDCGLAGELIGLETNTFRTDMNFTLQSQ